MGDRVSIGLLERAFQRFESDARSRAELASPKKSSGKPRVITISRQLGSGGRRVAETLGAWLGWPVWDKEILDVLAEQSAFGHAPDKFADLDERTQGEIDAVVALLFRYPDKHLYFHYLPKAISLIAQRDAIIIGRGAHLLLPDSLKVRIVASLDTRVANMMRFEGMDEQTARDRIAESDREREAFTRELIWRLRMARRRVADTEFDLTICTDNLSVEDAASLVLAAANKVFHAEGDGETRALAVSGRR